jgi:hypothetical protein
MVPGVARGIYVLFQEGDGERMNVVYIGRSTGSNKQGVGARLLSHNDTKKDWSHFSVFEVWQNVFNEIIIELEALILHIYSRDGTANKLNRQRNSKLFRGIRRRRRRDWKYRDHR